MYLSQHILAPVLVFLVLWLEPIQGQSLTFGGPSSGTVRPPSTRRPITTTFRPIIGLSPVAPGPVGPVGSTPSKRSNRTKHSEETEDLLLVLLQKVEKISQKQDHYQNVLLNAIKENGTQEILDYYQYLNSQSSFLMEQVDITTREIIKKNVEPTTEVVNTILNENSTDQNIDKRIGFSVRKAAGTDPSTFSLQASNVPISFQEVLSNVGNGFIGLVFKAPVAGHYFFTFHAQTTETGDFTMSLRKNGQYQVTAYGGKSGYQWGSNSALLNLNAGDTVYLQLDEGEIYEHPFNEAYTTFTGFLVFQ